MEILCTRPTCSQPRNHFADLDDSNTLATAQQKYCTSCGMPLILGGRYIPLQLLGQGGFGAAYLARDRYTTTMRQCVVKQFKPSGDLSPQQLATARELFEREAAVLEVLGNEHKQIPDSYAFFPLVVPGEQSGTEEQLFYLVQEYVDGEDLEQEQAHKGVYSEKDVLHILGEILSVLHFIHGRDSIHRDIKPSNIMRDKNGRLYLLDFGAVKQVASGAAVGSSGRSTGIYSMGFAPPEQMQGAEVYPSTDLYALAATCLVLLTGKSSEELYDAYHNQWDWRSHAPQVSDRLADTLDRMLLPTPRDRFQSARDVLEALTQSQAPPPPKPTPPPPSTPPPTPPTGSQTIAQPPPARPPQTPPATPPVPQTRSRQSFSLVEFLGSAAFTGFEGVVLYAGFASILPGAIAVGLVGASLGGLIYAQYRRAIEKWDFLILGAISLAIAVGLGTFFSAPFNLPSAFVGLAISLFMLSVLVAAVTVMVAILFRLIYQLLRAFL